MPCGAKGQRGRSVRGWDLVDVLESVLPRTLQKHLESRDRRVRPSAKSIERFGHVVLQNEEKAGAASIEDAPPAFALLFCSGVGRAVHLHELGDEGRSLASREDLELALIEPLIEHSGETIGANILPTC